ncbi:MAG: DNA recombination/repair protein RecA [Desulfobacterales bacterium]|nr:DNA recombination/repair protein RecA [Desulfobacterales bacterium]
MTERTRSTVVDQIRHRARSDPLVQSKERVEFLNTGSVLLNLAASQKARDGGWARGRVVNLVGDGSTGKTLLALEAAAQLYYYIKEKEPRLFPKVQNVEIVYWNREVVMDFPLEKMYGKSFVDAIDWSPKCSTAEEWGRDVMRRVIAHKPGTCFLGILDSIDSLATEGGQGRLAKSIKTDSPLDGSYGSGTERAKYFSADFFNNLCGEMKKKDFTLVLISQVRDKINAQFWEKKQYRAGGKALDFYTHQVVWLAVGERLKKEWDKQKRVYGITVRAKFERSKVSPPFREAEIDLLFDYGLDDIGSMAEFLPAERIQKVFQEKISREKLIEAADKNKGIYEKLVNAVEAYWREIETNTQIIRRPRFGG